MCKRNLRLLTPLSLALLSSCAITAPIQPAATTQSQFQAAQYKGTTVQVHKPTPGRETYRVFQQGATGLIPIQTVRDEAERRATDFCKRKDDATMESLEETVANPPFLLTNFPSVEIVFDCIPRTTSPVSRTDDSTYTALMNLKKLLDSGAITPAEFNAEKAKLLQTGGH